MGSMPPCRGEPMCSPSFPKARLGLSTGSRHHNGRGTERGQTHGSAPTTNNSLVNIHRNSSN